MSNKGLRLVVSSAGLALFSVIVTYLIFAFSTVLVNHPLEGLENQIFDLAFKTRNANTSVGRALPEEIVIVDIDDASIEKLGRTNLWPRAFDAYVLSQIGKGDPKGIVVDYLYTEADSLTSVYRQFLTESGVPQPDKVLKALSTDHKLAKGIEEAGKVYLAFFDDDAKRFSGDPDSAFGPPIRKLHIPKGHGKSFSKLSNPVFPIESFRNAAKAVGSINMPTERDGVVRYYSLLHRLPDSTKLTYAGEITLYLLADMIGIPDSAITVKADGLYAGEIHIPLRQDGRFRINWLGNGQKIRYVSYYKVLQDRIPPEFFKDKYVFLGTSASGLQDLKTVPSQDTKMPGVEVHAVAFLNLINEGVLTEFTPMQLLPLFILVTFLLMLLYQTLKPAFGLIAMFVLQLANLFGFVLYAFGAMGILYPVITVALLIFFGYISAALYNYFIEEQEKRRIQGAFSTYVSPEVVEEIVKNQGELKLGGEKKVLTVLFSDIRGFTTYSEQLDPQELVAILNNYLSRMNDIVFNHKGTIDKFIGDAVMAIFGAPVHQDDHADRSCRVALDMIRELEEVVNKDQREKGRQDLHIGIGLNTGDMTVGNIGSKKRFDYTVIGDAVNLGSRLEGLTKFFGVDILVSETTVAACTTKEFVFRELAPVKVKGKDKAMVVYELMGTATSRSGFEDFLTLWNKAYSAYKNHQLEEAEAAFNSCRENRPKDTMTGYYLERIQEAKLHPELFNPVIKMDTK